MYDNITLEKGLYNITGKTFTEALTELDSDADYIGTELEGLDAYQRQLKRFDIKVSGANSDRVEKFFKTTQSAVLFPEFVRRCIKAGMDGASVLPHVVAATVYTDGVDYRGLAITKNGTDTAVSAGSALPVTSVACASSTTSVSKYGRQIQTTYEVLRKQRLDLFAVVLKSVGAQISAAVNNAAATVLSTGVTPVETAAVGTIAYTDLSAFWASMEGHNMNAVLVSPANLAKILSITEMKDCVGDKNGNVVTPFGVKLVKCSGLTDEHLIGVDSNSALEMILGSDIIVDGDKLISTQVDNIAFSISVGFDKIYSTAVKVLKIKQTAQ